MERCGNTGTISSTLKRTGGVIGSAAGTISSCFNTGDVTGIYSCGGVAGSISSSGTKIMNCYNNGNVSCIEPTKTFSDSNAKGVGCIVGDPSSTSANGTLTNCYSSGTVTNTSTLEGITVGGVMGSSCAYNYSGTATKNLVKATNCYYLSAEGLKGDGYDESTEGTTAKTSDELKAADMASSLGEAYITRESDYPVLGWQDPNAKYSVSFNLSPSTAKLTVKQGENTLQPESDGSYSLANGSYTYEVSAEECETVNGSFTIAYSGQTVSVTLKETLYDILFVTTPTDAVLTVGGQTPLADGRTYRLPKSGNPYSYSAKAFGYTEKSGSFNVTGNATETVVLEEQATKSVTFGKITSEDNKEISPKIAIICPNWPNQAIDSENGSYQLPAGEYQYTVSCPGYKSVKGNFTISDQNINIPDMVLTIQTAWDGETYTEPQKDAESGAYLITTPDELMWFGKNASASSSATLAADIRINDDMSAETSTLYKWSFCQSSAFSGTFDGDGHTISGLYISSSSNNNGFIGKTSKGSTICNLTISDSLIQATGSANYTGAVVGDCCGLLENCHVTDTVKIKGQKYVGGVVGELDNGCSTSKCSNAGSVEGTEYVGGIAGRIYSNLSNALSESYNIGSVTGNNHLGGITGTLYNGGTISDCYNAGNVTSTAEKGSAGGLIGTLRSGSVKNTYQAGTVTASSAGSIAGDLDFASGQKTFDTVFALQCALEFIGDDLGYTVQNGEAVYKTEKELKVSASYLGDKFADDSKDINSGYPILKWQSSASSEPDPDQPSVDNKGWDGKTSTAPTQENGIYQIGTAAEFKWFADSAKKTPDIKGVLTADIDLNNQNWTPIGGITAETGFAGELDGDGHAISNFYSKSSASASLFYYNAGIIKDLTVNGKIVGGDKSAAIAAQNAGTISNCTSNVSVSGGNYSAGIAAVNNGKITNCKNHGAVNGLQYVGGISGENKGISTVNAIIENCINTGMIRANGYMVGGVVGNNEEYLSKPESAQIYNCGNSGHIINKASVMRSYTGGIIGRSNGGKAYNLYNSGFVASMGGCVSGVIGLDLSDTESTALYNIAYVLGGDYEDDGYPTNNTISTEAELTQAKADMSDIISLLGTKTAISGSLSVNGKAEVGETVQLVYSGEYDDLVYVWYFSYGENDDVVLAISDDISYTIPQSLVGRTLKVIAVRADSSGILKAESAKIEGLSGSLKITGKAVVGRTLTAEFKSANEYKNLKYQWYRGADIIEGATDINYTVTANDVEKVLTVKVTSSDAAGSIEANTGLVKTAAQADMWELSDCTEPAYVKGVYQITNEKELHWFASEVNGGNTGISAKLISDIELTTDNWYPIGRSGHAFAGIFDGNNKKITELKITSTRAETGFFGNIADGGKVMNLHVSGTVVATGDVSQTGGIAGTMDDGERTAYITGCSFSGSVSCKSQVGGIIGSVGLKNSVEQCRNSATVNGSTQVGGIAGANSYGYIRQCFNTGNVGNENTTYSGGIVGDAQNYAEVFACYNTGSVTGNNYIGGIAGNVYVAAMPTACYNTGNVSAGIYCGGAVGYFGGDTYITITTGSFYKGPLSDAHKANGAQMRTDAQMKDSSFVTELNSESFGTYFEKDTKNINNGYPVLIWQKSNSEIAYGDVNNDGVIDYLDASIVYAYYNGRITLTAEQLTIADVNDDGFVTYYDASLIYAYYNAKLTEFPVQKK